MVRNLRLRRGLLQDELAAELRDGFGLDWTRATVAAVESGRRQLRLDELPLVCAAFQCRPVDLFRGTGKVMLANGVTGRLSDVQKLMMGEYQNVRRSSLGWKRPEQPSSWRIVRLAQRDGVTIGDIAKASRAEAEMKAARKLGVDVEEVAAAALGTWKCSLTQQRDAIVVQRAEPDASPRTLQAMRGRVTRELVEELRVRIEEASSGER